MTRRDQAISGMIDGPPAMPARLVTPAQLSATVDLADALLVFDFDGTLAPIVRAPEKAAMRALSRRRLIAVAERQPVAVLSGRARADLLPRLAGVPLRHIVGSHGAEWAG